MNLETISQTGESLMPPKLEEDAATVRTQIVSSQTWVDRLNDWRRRQPGIPSKSEAIRILVERSLDADEAVR